MAKKDLKIPNLAKLRQFTAGMDPGKFLSTEFRQIVRAIEGAYVNQDVSLSDLDANKSSVIYSAGYNDTAYAPGASYAQISSFSLDATLTESRPITIGLTQDPQGVLSRANSADIWCNSGSWSLGILRTNLADSSQSVVGSWFITNADHKPASSYFAVDNPGPGSFNYIVYGGNGSGTSQIRYTRMYLKID